MQFTFEWTPEISVGETRLDDQHRRLLGMVNELLSAIVYKKGKARVEEAVHFLDEYVRTHLADEEAYMEEHGYPKLEEHKAMHAAFNASYDDFKTRLHQDGPTDQLAMRVQTHIGQWWMNHISKEDKKYAQYIADAEK